MSGYTNPNYVQPEGIVAASPLSNGNTGAVSNLINYTPAVNPALYRVSVVVNVTAWTTPASFNVVLTFKDDNGTARTYNMLVTGIGHSEAQAITAVDLWFSRPHIFKVDNSATAITVSTSGTFTGSPVYNIQAIVERLQ